MATDHGMFCPKCGEREKLAPRLFRTLDKAMEAADKVWPCKTN